MSAGTPQPIELKGLSYSVDGNTVLDDINLTVAPREIVAIMGRSGTGKTTLLRLIIGLIKPTEGSIHVNGTDITELDEDGLDRIRIKMGMVFQEGALFDSMTVHDNVAFALVEHRLAPQAEIAERVRQLLDLVEMAGTENLLPSQLSGGMRKRVGIARALASQPEIILYDEPTAGLDPISAAAIDALVVRLRDHVGVASVIVSHDVTSLRRVADRAALLHHGRFLGVGSIAELDHSPDPAIQQFLSGDPQGPLTEPHGSPTGPAVLGPSGAGSRPPNRGG
jgi:phospholipid/cholesterol/gamma-HCH transport system ATP-binding protein